MRRNNWPCSMNVRRTTVCNLLSTNVNKVRVTDTFDVHILVSISSPVSSISQSSWLCNATDTSIAGRNTRPRGGDEGRAYQ